MKAEQKAVIHKCRDCPCLLSAPEAILCPRCKAAAEEKRKAKKREKARGLYQTKQKKAPVPEMPHTRPPRPCATAGCKIKIEGNALYCPSCRHTRQLRHQKNYRDNVKARNADLPPEPPTNLKWLDKFKGWAGSGMSYADYQKAGMAQREK